MARLMVEGQDMQKLCCVVEAHKQYSAHLEHREGENCRLFSADRHYCMALMVMVKDKVRDVASVRGVSVSMFHAC